MIHNHNSQNPPESISVSTIEKPEPLTFRIMNSRRPSLILKQKPIPSTVENNQTLFVGEQNKLNETCY